jgi:hypothetical protein
MIAAWMLYCVAIAAACAVFGYALERGLHLARRATRWAWALALAGAFALPAAAWLRPAAFATLPLPAVDAVITAPPATGEPVATSELVPPATPAFSLRDLDGVLPWAWGLSSAVVLVVLVGAAWRLAALRRRWGVSSVDGRDVLVSENVGPAVVGLWPPRVIVPRWALTLTDSQRQLMLAHEEEHVRARDPWLLTGAAAALVLAPWNVVLWWIVQRLRLAVEVDCDARVLARGHGAPAYGDLLLSVGHHLARMPVAVPALGEPRSFLEHRIRRMAARLPRWRWAGVVVALAIAAGSFVAACETPRPVSPESARVDDAAAIADRVRERVDSAMAEHLRPWIYENLKRYYPDLLAEQNGPPVDIVFGHDSRRQVTHWARLTPSRVLGADRIAATFPLFRSGHDAWGVLDRRTLDGLVRANVRIAWVHLEGTASSASPPDTARRVPWTISSRQAVELVRQVFPHLLKGRDEPVYMWLVFDDERGLIAHGTAPRALTARAVSTEQAPQLIPGYDTLVARRALESGVIGYGVLGPKSPPVLWVRRVSDAAPQDPGGGRLEALQDQAALVRRLARDYHPEVVASSQPGAAGCAGYGCATPCRGACSRRGPAAHRQRLRR